MSMGVHYELSASMGDVYGLDLKGEISLKHVQNKATIKGKTRLKGVG